MNPKQRFRAIIEDAGDGGAYVQIPFDVEEVYGKKRVKIKALIEGEPYRGSIVRMGGPNHILIILKKIREAIGKSFGDEVEIELEEDDEPRKLILPEDFLIELAGNQQAKEFFDTLSFSNQKEYLQWVESAKREQTRQDRISQVLKLLVQGKRSR